MCACIIITAALKLSGGTRCWIGLLIVVLCIQSSHVISIVGIVSKETGAASVGN